LVLPHRQREPAPVGRWPHEKLGRYLDWLETLVSPPVDFNTALAASNRLEADLAQNLAVE